MPHDWSVLGRRGDPAPGDPGRVRALAGRLVRGADQVDHNTTRLRGIAANGGDLRLEGDYAAPFLQALGELPAELSKLGTAYRGCGHALSAYAAELEQAKTTATSAINQGTDAHLRVQGAQRQIRSLVPTDLQPLATARVFTSVSQTETLLARIDDEGIRTNVRHAVQRARYAETDRSRAAALANQAAELHHGAETRAVTGINNALNNSGIKNASWWKKAWDFMSAPFRSWDAFIDLCKIVAIVVGVLAMIIGGPILGMIALVVGLIVLADVLNKFRQGKATLADVGLELVGLIPGGRALGALGKLGSVLAHSKPLLKVVGPLKNAATSLPHGLKIAQGLRGALRDPRLFGRAVKCRFTGRDPIDMASGEMILSQTDLELPATLPLIIQRTHTTSYQVGRLFGPAWSSALDQRLEIDDTGIYYSSTDGMLQHFPTPDDDQPVLADEGPRVELRATTDGTYTITDPHTGQTLTFTEVPGADIGMVNLVQIADRNHNTIQLDYDPAAVLTTLHHSGGYTLDTTTHNGLVTAFHLRGEDTQPAHTLIRYDYNPAGMLTHITNSSNRPLQFSYDHAGRITKWEDRNNTWYTYTYDTHGRVITTAGTNGILNGTITYNDQQRTTTETNSLGHHTTYHFNTALQIETITNPLGHTTHHTWDQYDRPLTTTNPLGHTTTYTYDHTGNLTSVIRADGTQARTTFNDLHLPVALTGADGATWHRDYDQRGNLTTVTDPLNNATTWTYDDKGHLLSTTDALGSTIHYATNAAGLAISITDRAGAMTRYDRDRFGRISAVTDPLGSTTYVSWTVEGKIASKTLPDGATERWIYDAETNLIEHLDATGTSTRFAITGFDQTASRTNPDGGRMAFTYDSELRLTAVTNPQGLIWRYDYDAAGNLVRETDFNDRTITYAHDPAGRLATRITNSGNTHYIRDPLGRITEQRTGSTVTTFQYDPAGRLVGGANPDAVLTIERDPMGRVIAETCNGRTIASTYDPMGRRISRTTPSGAQSIWDYTANGTPSALRTAGQTIHFGYDAAGRETEQTFGTGVTLTQTWDSNSRLAAQTIHGSASQLLQHRAYTYRADGQITAIQDHLAGTRHFDLDPVGRVSTVHGPAGWTEQYRYDAAGNITDATWPDAADPDGAEAAGPRQYDGSRVVSAGRVRYGHDDQGRVVRRQRKVHSNRPHTWHYAWNAQDQLVGVTTPAGQHWTYRYDPLGRRISKSRLSEDGVSMAEHTDFAWDGRNLAEQTTTTGRITTWDWQPGTHRPVGQRERQRTTMRDAPQSWVDDRFYSIVTDLIGTPTELVGTDGNLAWRSTSTLWGVATQDTTAAVECPLRFPGQYHDPETQLNYNHFRYYDPETARYAASDPIGLPGGDNPHQYVRNPTTWLDPFGLSAGDYTSHVAGGPRVRPGKDIPVDENGMVHPPSPEDLAAKDVKGLSTYKSVDDIKAEGLKGQVRTPSEQLPPGLGRIEDGVEAGGTAPHGHMTVYPSESMPIEQFDQLIKDMNWSNIGVNLK